MFPSNLLFYFVADITSLPVSKVPDLLHQGACSLPIIHLEDTHKVVLDESGGMELNVYNKDLCIHKKTRGLL